MFPVRQPIRVIRQGYRWHVLRVEGAYEKKASLALRFYGAAGIIPHYELVRRLWVPEVTIEYFAKDGSQKERRAPMMPGYLFMEAILSYKLYAALKKPNFPHIFGWLQHWRSWPSMVPYMDIQRLAVLEAQNPEPVKLAFSVGDTVAIPSLGIHGTVLDISQSEITLNVEIFHRPLPFKVGREHFGEVVKVGVT